MLVKQSLRFFIIFKKAFHSLKGNDPLRMAAATSFFAFFALPPISLILSNLVSISSGNREGVIRGKLFDQLAHVFGNKSAHQLEDISENLQQIPVNPVFTILGIVFLLVSATTLFSLVKGSLNQLWNIKQKAKAATNSFLEDRLKGLAIILFSGILFITSLLADRLLAKLGKQLTIYLPQLQEMLSSLTNHLCSWLILTVWFAILFKYLPNINVRWKAVLVGAIVTSLLYKIGAYILEIVLIGSQAEVIFGASASIVLVLLFIFYASLIFYYGAAFTKVYAYYTRLFHRPTANATLYEIIEVQPSKG
jgi:membrane protein